MPAIFGLGLHVAIAIFFAIHCIRTNQNQYWLYILFLFPGMGSLVYFITIFLPGTRMPYEAQKVMRATGKILNPEKELREAAIAWDETPTVQNRLRLAQAQLGRGLFDAAIENFTACLEGPFSDDPNIRQGLARAYFAADNIQAAITQLETLHCEHPDLDSEECDLLLARAYAAAQRNNEAGALFEQTLQKFGTFPCEAEYAIWLLQQGERRAAQPLLEAIARRTRRWTRYNRQYYQDIFQRLKAAQNEVVQA